MSLEELLAEENSTNETLGEETGWGVVKATNIIETPKITQDHTNLAEVPHPEAAELSFFPDPSSAMSLRGFLWAGRIVGPIILWLAFY